MQMCAIWAFPSSVSLAAPGWPAVVWAVHVGIHGKGLFSSFVR